MRTQMNTQDLHTNLLYQQQEWMNQAGQQLNEIQETIDENVETLARAFRQWAM
jgi:hypothetical protein